MTEEQKLSEKSIAFIQEFFTELQGLQRVIEKGEPFSSLGLEKIVAQLPDYPDLPKEFNGLVTLSQKVVEQIKNLYGQGLDVDRLVIIQQIFAPLFQLITAGSEKIARLAKA